MCFLDYDEIYTDKDCLEQNRDYPGYDIYTVKRADLTKEECSYRCYENSICKVWLFVGKISGAIQKIEFLVDMCA